MENIRLQKIIASRGYCSRRKAEELILQGKVRVDGEVVTELGRKFDEDVSIEIDGFEALNQDNEKVAFVFNKPLGVLSTCSDDRGRRTIIDFFKYEHYRLFSIGRLDYNTAGCILVSNDGELSNLVSHPSSHLEKTYIVTVKGFISDESLRKLHDGVLLDDGMTQPAKIAIGKRNEDISIFKITIHEGRNRQVRRMCQAVGHDVLHLFRESVGSINVKNIERGKYRRLSAEEVENIKNICKKNKKENVIPFYKKK